MKSKLVTPEPVVQIICSIKEANWLRSHVQEIETKSVPLEVSLRALWEKHLNTNPIGRGDD